MNVYDFDQTIFYPDSSYCFTLWYLKKHPLAALICAVPTAVFSLLYLLKLVTKERFKEKIFAYVRYIDDIDAELKRFWEEKEHKLCAWYLEQRREDDVIVSASPDFMVRPIAEKLGFRLIATDMDKKTGRIRGRNCDSDEKLRRFRLVYPEAEVESFYSDSLSDAPMAGIARRAYLVRGKGQRIVPWPAAATDRLR